MVASKISNGDVISPGHASRLVAIDGMRRCVFYGQPPRLGLSVIAGTVAAVELAVTYVVFKQMETGFADVA